MASGLESAAKPTSSGYPPFPTSFSGSEAETYAEQIGVIFAGFAIAAVLFSLIMLIFCCVYCCCKSPNSTTSYNKLVHLIIACFIMLISILGCAIGWGYNARCDRGVDDTTASITQLLNGSATVISNVQNAILNATGGLQRDITHLVNTMEAENIGQVTSNLNLAISAFGNMTADTNNLNKTSTDVISDASGLYTNVENIQAEAQRTGQSNVLPAISEIPTPTYLYPVNLTVAAGISVVSQQVLINARSVINAALTQITDDLIQKLNNSNGDYTGNLGTSADGFNNTINEINSITSSYQPYQSKIDYYSAQRTMAVNGVLILPFLIGFLGVAAAVLKMTILMRIVSVVSFIVFFWYVLCAGIQYTLWAVLAGFCAAESQILDNILANGGTMTSNNVTFNVSTALIGLLNCSGDTTIFDLFHANYILDDFKTDIVDQINLINNTFANVSFAAYFDEVSANTTSLYALYSVDFVQGKDITTVQSELTQDASTTNSYDANIRGNASEGLTNSQLFAARYPTAYNQQNKCLIDLANAESNMTATQIATQNYIVNNTRLVEGVLYDAIGYINAFGVATECAPIGDGYHEFLYGFCSLFAPSLQVLAAMMMLGATTLFCTVLHNCVMIHRIQCQSEKNGVDKTIKKAIAADRAAQVEAGIQMEERAPPAEEPKSVTAMEDPAESQN